MNKIRQLSFIIILSMLLGMTAPYYGAYAAQDGFAAETVSAQDEVYNAAANEEISEATELSGADADNLTQIAQDADGNTKIADAGGEEGLAINDEPLVYTEWDVVLPTNDVLPLVEVPFNESLLDDEEEQGPETDDRDIIRLDSPDSTYANVADGYSTYGYDQLSTQQKEFYSVLKQKCEAFIGGSSYAQDLDDSALGISATYNGKRFENNEIMQVYWAFKYDNPQYYWIDSLYSGQATDTSTTLQIYIDPYYQTAAARAAADAKITEIGDAWVEEISGIKESEGTYAAVVRAHDLILNRINYAYNSAGQPETSRFAHCMAGVFTAQGVVCEGYSRCLQYLLNKVDIDNVYIVGMGGGEGHAWNSVLLDDGKYWLIDATWDDVYTEETGLNEAGYSYFCLPVSEFNRDHNPNNMGYVGMYTLPENLGNTFDSTYYAKYGGYSSSTLTGDSAQTLVDNVRASKPDGADYLHFALPDSSSVQQVMGKFGINSVLTTGSNSLGVIFRIEDVEVNNPADSISLSKTTAHVEVGESLDITATLPEGSDDRVKWTLDNNRAAKLSTDGLTATVRGVRNGDVTLTATTYKGKATAACAIQVGEGAVSSAAVIWQNGTKEYKSITLKTSLTASNWKDSKGKTKKGKLVWIASDTEIEPQFDSGHKLTSKPKPTNGKVSNKGVVTAKVGGRLYVYACDTGRMDYESFVVEVLGAPNKLYLSKKAGSKETSDLLKKGSLRAGDTGKVYITPYMKTGEADVSNEYKVSLAKASDSSYVTLSAVAQDDDGNAYFTVTGKNFNKTKGKAASVKINVQSIQSGKKASMTLLIYNPVTAVATTVKSGKTVASGAAVSTGAAPVNAGGGTKVSLAQKKDSASLQLNLTTAISGETKTSDKLKVYVGHTSIEVNSKGKPVADKGAAIKAKLDVKTLQLVLTASKNAGATAVIKLAATNAATKQTELFDIGTVDEQGILTLK